MKDKGWRRREAGGKSLTQSPPSRKGKQVGTKRGRRRAPSRTRSSPSATGERGRFAARRNLGTGEEDASRKVHQGGEKKKIEGEKGRSRAKDTFADRGVPKCNLETKEKRRPMGAVDLSHHRTVRRASRKVRKVHQGRVKGTRPPLLRTTRDHERDLMQKVRVRAASGALALPFKNDGGRFLPSGPRGSGVSASDHEKGPGKVDKISESALPFDGAIT